MLFFSSTYGTFVKILWTLKSIVKFHRMEIIQYMFFEPCGINYNSILPGKSLRQRSLAGYSPWGHKRVGQDLVFKHFKDAHDTKVKSD